MRSTNQSIFFSANEQHYSLVQKQRAVIVQSLNKGHTMWQHKKFIYKQGTLIKYKLKSSMPMYNQEHVHFSQTYILY